MLYKAPTAPRFPVISSNKGAERLFGFTADEAIGHGITQLYVAPEPRDNALASLQENLAEFPAAPPQSSP